MEEREAIAILTLFNSRNELKAFVQSTWTYCKGSRIRVGIVRDTVVDALGLVKNTRTHKNLEKAMRELGSVPVVVHGKKYWRDIELRDKEDQDDDI